MFDLIDRKKTEKITLEDFKKMCNEMGIKIEENELNEIFLEISKKKGAFTFDDFDEYLEKQYAFK